MVYGNAPWQFKGRAIYQLQLVKSEEAKKYIPDKFKIVELFGYTLGGFYLARYSDSPVGAFDELVVLSGLVWNESTSCAWAARVFVNNKEARNHGLHSVGLPSRLAAFQLVPKFNSSVKKTNPSWWHQHSSDVSLLRGGGKGDEHNSPLDAHVQINNCERGWFFGRGKGLKTPICTMDLPAMKQEREWGGPKMRLQLPSFSGGTREFPNLLQYTCQLFCSIRPMKSVKIHLANCDDTHSEDLSSVLRGKSVLALAFNDMVMHVDSPLLLEA
eukprot:TRINITY_DN19708_c2_g1_i1.p1 TRINITY_DN19708_c2_g1~~TRINITY_DN19708_c2_g1_i1.p1  ORF type:complete len:271 (+),score=44.66 TRINITY_DN19708_c2_g1_i1:83-895(+)